MPASELLGKGRCGGEILISREGDRVEFAALGEEPDAGVVVKVGTGGGRGYTVRVRPDHPGRHRTALDGTIGVNDFEITRIVPKK